MKLLTGIRNLLYPAPVTTQDGRTMVFRPGNSHEFMQALSDRIRALPDEMSARGYWVMPNAELTGAPR